MEPIVEHLSKTIQEACDFYFNWIIENYMVPGHVENWIFVLDMNDVGVTQIPVSSLKGLMQAM